MIALFLTTSPLLSVMLACPASFLFPLNKVNYNGGNKMSLMHKHRKNYTDKLMCGSQDSLSVHQPLLSSFHEIFTKRLIIANHFLQTSAR